MSDTVVMSFMENPKKLMCKSYVAYYRVSTLQAAKARGVKLGNPQGAAAFGDRQGLNKTTVAANEARKGQAQEKIELLKQFHADGLSVKEIVKRTGLNVRLVYRALIKK
jgi:DNA invertase Pin-like site-specific DNA recombinase